MKKILAVCASVIAFAAMSVCAFAADAPANGDLLIATQSNNPSDPVTPDDGNKGNNETNTKTGAEGLALGAAVVLSGAVMLVSAKRR